MKRKYREAMRAAARQQDAYIDGLNDDQIAAEARDWHNEHTPEYAAAPPNHHLDEQLPF